MQYSLNILQNKLPVLLINTQAFPSAATLLLVKAGSRYENERNNGTAHFFEHMAFKGSKRYPTSFDLASTIEGFGGNFNAFTSKDKTGYWIKSPLEHVATSIEVIADMVQNSLLKEEEIEKEKGVIIEEMNMYEDTPSSKVSDIYEQLLYEGHPLGMDIIGKKDTVQSATRQTLLEYLHTFYYPNNAVLVVAGGLADKEEEIMKTIEKEFIGWEPKDTPAYKPFEERQTSPRLTVYPKVTEQAHLIVGYRTASLFHEHRYALMLLSVILGGGMSSVLFNELREKRGLCYYVSSMQESYEDVGNFATQAGIRSHKDALTEAVQVIIQEHERIAQKGVADDQLERAKDYLAGRIILSLENSNAVASYFGGEYLMKKTITPSGEYISRIKAVTKEQIQEVAELYFTPANLNIALVGNFKKEDFSHILPH